MSSPEVCAIVPVVEAAIPECRVGGPVFVVALLVAVVPRLIFVPDGIRVGFGRVPVRVALVTVGIALIALRLALIILSGTVVVLGVAVIVLGIVVVRRRRMVLTRLGRRAWRCRARRWAGCGRVIRRRGMRCRGMIRWRRCGVICGFLSCTNSNKRNNESHPDKQLFHIFSSP
jgi:hypothetical protein